MQFVYKCPRKGHEWRCNVTRDIPLVCFVSNSKIKKSYLAKSTDTRLKSSIDVLKYRQNIFTTRLVTTRISSKLTRSVNTSVDRSSGQIHLFVRAWPTETLCRRMVPRANWSWFAVEEVKSEFLQLWTLTCSLSSESFPITLVLRSLPRHCQK
jgi:hypothetical protein